MSQLQPLKTIKHNQKCTIYGYCRTYDYIPIAVIELIFTFYKLMIIRNDINKTSTFKIIKYNLLNKTNFFCFNFTNLFFKEKLAICIVEDIKDIPRLSKLIEDKKFSGCLFDKNGADLYQNSSRYTDDDHLRIDEIITSKDSIKITHCSEIVPLTRDIISVDITQQDTHSVTEASQYPTSTFHPFTNYLCIVLFDRNDSICYENMTFGDSEYNDTLSKYEKIC